MPSASLSSSLHTRETAHLRTAMRNIFDEE
jgi:hypothetical protein